MIRLFLTTFALICAAGLAIAQTAEPDHLTDTVWEIATIDGRPVAPAAAGLPPRLRIGQNTVVYGEICYPSQIARNGLSLGGPLDKYEIEPRPAIHCASIPQSSAQIADAFGRAQSIITSRSPQTIHFTDGENIIMTLHAIQ